MASSQSRNLGLPSADDDYFYHRMVLRCLANLKYSASMLGVCDGLGSMALQAMLIDDVEAFNQRLLLLRQFDQQISHLKTQLLDHLGVQYEPDPNAKWMSFYNIVWNSRKFKSLSTNDSFMQELNKEFAEGVDKLLEQNPDRVNLLAFLDGVLIHQNPNYVVFSDFDAGLRIEPPLNPQIEAQKGLTVIDKFSGIYTTVELVNLFKTLQSALVDFKHTTILRVTNFNHAIYIGYNGVSQAWIFCDANYLPIKSLGNADDVVSHLMLSFQNAGLAALNIKMYSLGLYAQTLQPLMQNFRAALQDVHEITPARAKLKETSGATWLYLACAEKESELVSKLLAAGADPSPVLENFASTFAVLGTTINKNDIAQHLLQHGAIPNFRDYLMISMDGSEELKIYLEPKDMAKRRATIRDSLEERKGDAYTDKRAAVTKIVALCGSVKDVSQIELTLEHFIRLDTLVNLIDSVPKPAQAGFSTLEFKKISDKAYSAFASCNKDDEAAVIATFKSDVKVLCNLYQPGVVGSLVGMFGVKYGPTADIKKILAADELLDSKPQQSAKFDNQGV